MDILYNFICFFINNKLFIVFNNLTMALSLDIDFANVLIILMEFTVVLLSMIAICGYMWTRLPIGEAIFKNMMIMIFYIIGIYVIAQLCMLPINIFLFIFVNNYSIEIGYILFIIEAMILIAVIGYDKIVAYTGNIKVTNE